MTLKRIAFGTGTASLLISLVIALFMMISPYYRGDPLFSKILATSLAFLLTSCAFIVFHPRLAPAPRRQPAQAKQRRFIKIGRR